MWGLEAENLILKWESRGKSNIVRRLEKQEKEA